MEKFSQNDGIKDDLKEMGRFYLLSKQYNEAIKSLESALKLNARDPEIYYLLGMVYESIHEYDKAKTYYEKVVELEPDFKDAEDRISKIIGE